MLAAVRMSAMALRSPTPPPLNSLLFADELVANTQMAHSSDRMQIGHGRAALWQ